MLMDMTMKDYLANAFLIALVVRQIRGKRLTAVGLLWPVALVIGIGIEYLHGVPLGGDDLALILAAAAVGAGLGLACGALTRIHRTADGAPLAKATGVAAALWVAGVGARTAFAIYAQNGGGPTIARFGTAHDIAAAAWAPALVLMSLAEVVGRSVTLAVRAYPVHVHSRSSGAEPG